MATQQHSASADGTQEPLDRPPTSDIAPYATLGQPSDPDATRDFAGSLPGVTPAMRMGWPTIDDYEILAELGRGGMGVVYKARQISLNRIVAIKRVLSGSNIGWEELNRFRGEAEAVAQLQHPNIVQVYEIGESGGSPYFSLEFVDGGSLEKQFAATPQPPADAARTIAVLARAIHFAHGKGIVHRDLKPANVLLASDGTLKVTDFGLAKRLDDDSGHTRSGAIMGTPSYMAPEQAYGKSNEIGPAADIYALGAVLYAALTGHPPFRGATAWETVEQVRIQEPVPPRRLLPKLPRDLETICLKCLLKEPERRFATALELAEDLERFLDGRPVLVRPVPAWERAYRWARRRPAQAAAVAALALAVVGGSTGAVFYGLYEDQQASAVQKRLDSRQRVDGLWGQGQQAESGGQLTAAKECWDKALAELDADPTVAPAELRRQIEEHQQHVAQLIQQQANRQHLLDQLAQFNKLRDDVLFRAVNLREQDAAANRTQILQSGPAALKALDYSLDQPPDVLATKLRAYREVVSPGKFSQLAADCFRVLLSWADAEAGDADRPGGVAAAAGRAVQLLDAAAAAAKEGDLPSAKTFHARLAQYCQAVGDATRAQAEQQLAAAAVKETPLDHFLTGLDDYRKQQFSAAATESDAVLRDEPDNFWARYLNGLCLLKQGGRWAEAKISLSDCLGQRADFFWARLLRGAAEGQLQETAAAEDDFAEVLRETNDPFACWSVLTTRGAMRIRGKHWDDAVADLQQAIKDEPDSPEGYVNLSLAFQGSGNWDAAMQALDQAIARRPDDAALYHDRAVLNNSRGNLAAAQSDFLQATQREPKGHQSERLASDYVELAILQHRAGDDQAALASCDSALKARTDYPPAYRQQAESLIKLGKYAAAGAALDQYLAHGQQLPEVYFARGLIHTELHEYQAAIDAYSRSLMLAPDKAAYDHRGWAYLSLDALRPALADFDAALKLNPTYLDSLCGRAYVRARLGQVKEGAADADVALAQKPQEPKLLFILACAYAQSADRVPVHQPNAITEFTLYRSRAIEQLVAAMTRVPEDQRKQFWKTIENARELTPLLETPKLIALTKQYGS